MRPYILIVSLCVLASKAVAGGECNSDDALLVLSRDAPAASSFCSELLGTTIFVTEGITQTIATTVTFPGETETLTVTVTKTIDEVKKRSGYLPACRRVLADDRHNTWSTWDTQATTTKNGNGPWATSSACSCLIVAPTAISTISEIETTITLPSTFTLPPETVTETTTAFETRSS